MWIWLLEPYREWASLWTTWYRSGPLDPRTPLWGSPLYGWTRAGTAVALLAAVALGTDVCSAERRRLRVVLAEAGVPDHGTERAAGPMVFLVPGVALVGLGLFLAWPSLLRESVSTSALTVFSGDATPWGVLLLVCAVALVLTLMIALAGLFGSPQRRRGRLDAWRHCAYLTAAVSVAYFVIARIGRSAPPRTDTRYAQFLLTWGGTVAGGLLLVGLALLILAHAADETRARSRLWRWCATAALLLGLQFALLSS
jgi:hypothetical protein